MTYRYKFSGNDQAIENVLEGIKFGLGSMTMAFTSHIEYPRNLHVDFVETADPLAEDWKSISGDILRANASYLKNKEDTGNRRLGTTKYSR